MRRRGTWRRRRATARRRGTLRRGTSGGPRRRIMAGSTRAGQGASPDDAARPPPEVTKPTTQTPAHDWMRPRLIALLAQAERAGMPRDVAVAVLMD